MSKTEIVPSGTTRTDVQIGLVVADQRTGDLRRVIYADSQSVLMRDEMASTTLMPRKAFERALGTRFHPRPEADPNIDGGQYERLRNRLAEYAGRDGRKARHKADAIREALDLLSGSPEEEADTEDDREVTFEDIPGIGPETARNLRRHGFVTVVDVDSASDDELSSVAGVGPDALEKIRAAVEP